MEKNRARPKSISVYPIDEEIIQRVRQKHLLSSDSDVVQWVLRRLVRSGEIELSEGEYGESEPVRS